MGLYSQQLKQILTLLTRRNGGAWAAATDGVAIADVPGSAQRIGTSYLDVDFIAAHTHGLEALKQDLAAESWERIEAQSGLARAEIAAAAQIYIKAERVICTWAMGLTQHKGAVETIQ